MDMGYDVAPILETLIPFTFSKVKWYKNTSVFVFLLGLAS